MRAVAMCSSFFFMCLEMGQSPLGVGVVLFSPTEPAFGPCLFLDLNPMAVLCCAYSQHPEQGHLAQKSTALPPLWPLLQLHPIVSHSMSLPAILVGSSHQCLIPATSPLSPGCCRGVCTKV